MLKLKRDQRQKLIRVGGDFMREYPGVERFEVAEKVFDHMMQQEDEYGLAPFEAVEISDYAYGVASFLVHKDW